MHLFRSAPPNEKNLISGCSRKRDKDGRSKKERRTEGRKGGGGGGRDERDEMDHDGADGFLNVLTFTSPNQSSPRLDLAYADGRTDGETNIRTDEGTKERMVDD